MKKLKLFLLVALLSIGLVGWTVPVRADVSDFVINSFVADYTLTRADPQGQLRVVEDIDLTFSANNHGILRAIPNRYNNHRLELKVNKISSESGAPAEYTTYQSSGNTVLKIGSPSRTVTGQQNYVIDYTLNNVVKFGQSVDELYWDINGDQWSQPIEYVAVYVHLPDDNSFFQSPTTGCQNYTEVMGASQECGGQVPDMDCFTGAYGSQAKNCRMWHDGSNTVSFETTGQLLDNQTLTIAVGFDKGYFRPSNPLETVAEYRKELLGVMVMPLLLGGWAWRRWRKYGRDPKGRGVVVAQYDAPNGLKPIEVGAITDFRVDDRDITATIISLAINKYIKIIETKKDRLIGKDRLEYEFELLNPDISKLAPAEAKIFQGLFETMAIGQKVTMKQLAKNKLYVEVAAAKKLVPKELATSGFFLSNPASSATRIWVVAGLVGMLLFTIGGLFGLAFVIGSVIALIITVGFALAMPSRTDKGVAAREHVEGLKLYLNTAEKDRLETLQSPDAPYARSGNEPVKNVELFEKLLPFAIALGVEKSWAKQFEGIYTQPPDWFSGNWTAFNSAYLVSSIGGGLKTSMNTAFAAPSSSGSSGLGGGGFSGGGGGGGGGGGW